MSALLLEIERVDRMHTALWPKAMKGDVAAVDRLTRLSSRRLLLLEQVRTASGENGEIKPKNGSLGAREDPRDAPTSGGMTDYQGVDVPNATAHLRPKRNTRARFSKVASARDTIAGFGHEMDVAGLTYGQFSLLDLIQATLEVTGPADVAIATWSAGFYDVDAAERFRDSGMIRSIRFVMDSSGKRGQATVGDVAEIFGESSVRATRSHAKFALVSNDEWDVLITSSMNLNLNPRCEQFEMTDDAQRAAVFHEFVDAVFSDLPEGARGDRQLPGLFDVEAVQPHTGVAAATRIRTGRWD